MGKSGSTKRIRDGKEFPIEEESVLGESGPSIAGFWSTMAQVGGSNFITISRVQAKDLQKKRRGLF